MVSLTAATESKRGVTLVTVRLDGGPVAQRVRLDNRLDGPVWPPRRQGVPEAGWDDSGFATVVPAESTVAVGYASPAAPADPPVEITEQHIVDGDAVAGSGDAVTPASAIRELGDPSPPRDAVPLAADTVPSPSSSPSSSLSPEPAGALVNRPDCTAAPPAVTEWLDDVEARVAVAEALAAAESLPEATAALREAGDLADATDLVETLEAEAADLAAVADRINDISTRAREADVPLATFERLA